MKQVRLFLLAVVVGVGLVGFAGDSEAAPNLVGTWAGQARCAGVSSFWTPNLEFAVLEQTTAGLFRGTMYDMTVTGYVSGTTVRINVVKKANIELAPSYWSHWDAKYVDSSPRKLTGYYRDSDGNTCSFTFSKRRLF